MVERRARKLGSSTTIISDSGTRWQVLPVLVESPLESRSTRIKFARSTTVGKYDIYGPYHGLYDRPTAPDDSWIAFVAQVGGEPSGLKAFDLFRVSSDGLSPAVNVTNGTARPRYPDGIRSGSTTLTNNVARFGLPHA